MPQATTDTLYNGRKSYISITPLQRFLSWIIATIIACAALIQVAAQGGATPSNAQNSVDYRSRSDVKVDPATGALQLQLTLGSYKGRSGLDLPVTLSYSSKVWEMHHRGTIFRGSECQDCQGEPDATYQALHALYSAGGWTSSLDWFRWGAPPSFETYDDMGRPCTSGCVTQVARLYVRMPDGSRHEFMKNNFFHPFGALPTGIYHSVDGSRMRYDTTSGTLYLPDGSRHETGHDQDGVRRRYFIDRHGNRLEYNESTRVWKDTLGREFALPPLDSSAPAERTYSLPGLSVPYNLVWKRLGDEGVRTDESQELHYLGDRTTTWPHTPVSPHLFTSPNINDSVTDGSGQRFNPVLLHKIVLPNGTAYTFTYNVYGEIDKVVYPTGGYEKFTHGMVPPLSNKTLDLSPAAQTNRGVRERRVSAKGDGSDEVTWSYSPGPNGFIVSPDNTRTEINHHLSDGETVLYGYENPLAGRAYEEKVVSASGQVLRRKLTEWVSDGSTHQSGPYVMHVRRNPRVAKEVEVIFDRMGNALSATTEYEYDSDLNVKKVKRYDYREAGQAAATAPIGDFLAGNLLRIDETDYLTGDQNYRDRQMTSLPTATRVKDAAGTIIAQTAISYDEPSIGLHPCGAEVGWVDPATSFHGNATTVKRWLNTTDTWVEAHAEYDKCGNLRRSRDAHYENDPQHGSVSQVFYDDAFSDGGNRNTYAYPTKAVSAVPDESGQRGSSASFQTQTTYDFATGLVTSATDINDAVTNYFYTTPGGTPDPLNRLGRVERPDGGWTSYEYGDAPGGFFVRTRTAIDGGRSTEAYQYFDGLSRPSRAYTRDGSSADRAWVAVKTQHDEAKRQVNQSNPHFRADLNDFDPLSATAPVPVTTTTSDQLGRVTSVVTPDGATVATAYDRVKVTVTDQAGKSRSSVSDALGRLMKVVEAPGVTNYGFETAYEYDVLGNLKKVTQGKLGQTQQTRTFLYDSLSRLVSTANPEVCQQQPDGTCPPAPITYEYDPEGNLRKKTDARLVQTEYDYDGLNRVKRRHYTLTPGAAAPPNYVASPTVDYYYDGTGMPLEDDDTQLPTPENAKGLLTAVKSAVSHTAYTEFDVMGRVMRHRQIAEPGTGTERAYKMEYGYDLAGNLMSQTYPSGKVVVTEYDAAGRVAGVKRGAGGSYYVGASPADAADRMSYAAHGAVESARLGNGLWERTQYNSRLQPEWTKLGTTDGTSDRWRLDYGYGPAPENNGNVRQQTVTVPTVNGAAGFVAVQSYTYDPLNRIEAARETKDTAGGEEGWRQRFTYDQFGNRRIDGNPAAPSASQTTPALVGPNPLINPATNRLSSPGYSYDAAGNLTNDPQHTYEYDSENRIAANDRGGDPNVATVYAYDGDGRRVRKAFTANGAVVVFVYDAMGRLVAEYANDAQPASTGGTSYLTQDHLGSTRVVTAEGKAVKSRHDFLPFGEEVMPDSAAGSGRAEAQGYRVGDVRQKFTGYERDGETGLDYAQARYYSNTQGRFVSVDPLLASAKTINPQSWNRYTYVLNRPTIAVDPNGLSTIIVVVSPRSSRGDGSASVLVLNDCGNTVPVGRHGIFHMPGLAKGNGSDRTRTNNDTPFGVYRIHRDVRSDKNENGDYMGTQGGAADSKPRGAAYGTGIIYMEPVAGEVVDSGRSTIYFHGGGTALGEKAFDPDQALVPTHGCVRLHNQDVNALISTINDLEAGGDPVGRIFIGDAPYLNNMADQRDANGYDAYPDLRTSLGLEARPRLPPPPPPQPRPAPR